MSTLTFGHTGAENKFIAAMLNPHRPKKAIEDEAVTVTGLHVLKFENDLAIENLSSETEKGMSIVENLLRKREPIVRDRSLLIDKPFFLIRKNLHAEVQRLDGEIAAIDLELNRQRQGPAKDTQLFESIYQTTETLRMCVERLENLK